MGDWIMAKINGTTNDDTLKGGVGNDIITGGLGNDLVIGGAGNDVVIWNLGDGNDTVQGGTGFDTLRYADSASSAGSISLSANGAGARLTNSGLGTAVDLSSVERIELRSSDGADYI